MRFHVKVLSIILFIGAFTLHAESVKTLAMKGVRFHVELQGNGSLKTLVVKAGGLERPIEPFQREIDGELVDAVTADLDGNGFAELYLVTSSAGSGSYGNIVAFASNRNRSITPIHMQTDTKLLKGYMGHDRFIVRKDRIVRTFPVYRRNDSNCCPSGGKRTLVYKLVPGEATWQLVVVEHYDTPVPI